MSAPEELPPAAELMRRVNVASSILTGRPFMRRTVELAVLALAGASADDLLDVMCRSCRDMPAPGVTCPQCELSGPSAGVA